MNYDKLNMYIPVLIQWYSLHQESVVRGRPEFPTQLVYNKEHENDRHSLDKNGTNERIHAGQL